MKIPSPELVKRIQTVVSSMLGVTTSRVDREEDGSVRGVYAAVAPGHSPGNVHREIRSALRSSLDYDLEPSLLHVEVEEQVGRRQQEFWAGPDRERRAPRGAGVEEHGSGIARRGSDMARRGSDIESSGADIERPEMEERRDAEDRRSEDRRSEEDRRSGDRRAERDRRSEDRRSREDRRSEEERRTGERREGDRRSEARPEGDRRSEGHPERDRSSERGREAGGGIAGIPDKPIGRRIDGGGEEPPASRRPERVAPRRPERPAPEPRPRPGPSGDVLPLSLGGYSLHGVADGGTELRVGIVSGGEPFEGVLRIPTLESVSPGIFVGAVLRAVEQVLDAHPIRERSSRILILEAVDVETVELRQGRFVATTVAAVKREGESRATGLSPEAGRGLRNAAARAALEAVSLLLEDREVEWLERDALDARVRRRHAGRRSREMRGRSDRAAREYRGDRDHQDARARGRSFEGAGGFDPATDRDPFHVWE